MAVRVSDGGAGCCRGGGESAGDKEQGRGAVPGFQVVVLG